MPSYREKLAKPAWWLIDENDKIVAEVRDIFAASPIRISMPVWALPTEAKRASSFRATASASVARSIASYSATAAFASRRWNLAQQNERRSCQRNLPH